jgi:hypothetical protein
MGSQQSFGSPLKQSILGCKWHGQGVTLFRTIDTVSKSADLTVHAIFAMVDKFYEKYSYYPEELYVQVDGG